MKRLRLSIDAEESYIENLEELAIDAVEDYHDKYDEELPIKFGEEQRIVEDREEATREDVEGFVEELSDFYDDLLGTDSSAYQSSLKDSTIYNPSLLESVTQYPRQTTGQVSAAGCATVSLFVGDPILSPLVGLGSFMALSRYESHREGSYHQWDGYINVSQSQQPFSKTYRTLGAELYHAIQHREGSPTDSNEFLKEGSERASHIKAIKDYADRHEDEGFEKFYDAARAGVLVRGTSQLKKYAEDSLMELSIFSREDEIETHLTEEESSIYRNPLLGRCGSKEYDIGAAALFLAEDEQGEEIYEEVFRGDYSSLPDWMDSKV